MRCARGPSPACVLRCGLGDRLRPGRNASGLRPAFRCARGPSPACSACVAVLEIRRPPSRPSACAARGRRRGLGDRAGFGRHRERPRRSALSALGSGPLRRRSALGARSSALAAPNSRPLHRGSPISTPRSRPLARISLLSLARRKPPLGGMTLEQGASNFLAGGAIARSGGLDLFARWCHRAKRGPRIFLEGVRSARR